MDVAVSRSSSALHDNLGWGGPSATRSFLGIGDDDWFLVAGGDGFVATADPTDSRTIYAESQNGNMSRVDRVTNERVPIRPEPAESEEPYKWNFNTPMLDLGARLRARCSSRRTGCSSPPIAGSPGSQSAPI